MLRFKQFIKELYLIEAKAEHFNNIPDLDPKNPKHKDLIDAYNNGLSAESGKKVGVKLPKPGQIKSIEQLKTAVKPHLDAIEQKRKEDKDDKEAFDNGEATLIHHNPETGATVTQVSSQAGSCAAKASSTWCTGQRNAAKDMVHHYDKEGNKSFVFKFPKEKKKNLRTVGAYGENRQDAENHLVVDHDWNRLVKEHGLDKIKHLKGSVGGIDITKDEKTQYAKELSDNIKDGTVSSADVAHAKANNYLSNEHKKSLVINKNTNPDILSKLSSDSELHKEILKHPNVNKNTLSAVVKNSKDPEIHNKALMHPNVGVNTLNALSRYGDKEIYKKILNHPKVEDSVISTIATKSRDPEIHKIIANHKNSGDLGLAAVSRNSNDPEIHKSILKHSNVGAMTLNSLSNNESNTTEVQKEILNHQKANDKVFSNLTEHGNSEVHKAILNHPKADEKSISDLERKTRDPEILKSIAKNPKTDENTLDRLTWRQNTDLHKLIIKHPNVDEKTLSSLASTSNDPEILKSVLNHPKAGKGVMSSLAQHTRDPEIHKALIAKPETDDSDLSAIAMNSNDPSIHRAILSHPNAGTDSKRMIDLKKTKPINSYLNN